MRFLTVSLLAALSAVVVAQDDVLSALPECAQTCFGNNFGDCTDLDFACICGNAELISSISCCVSRECSAEEQKNIIDIAVGLCEANDVQVPTSASCAATASPTPSQYGTGSGTTASPSMTSADSQESSSPTSDGEAAEDTGGAAPLATAGAGLGVALAGLLMAL